MIMRGITSSNDWIFGGGINSYFQGEQAIEANIKTKLLEWVGNCYFDLPAGIDWKNRLDIGQQAALIVEIKNMVLNCFGVVSILQFQATFNGATRFDSVQMTLQTIYSRSAIIVITPPVVGVI